MENASDSRLPELDPVIHSPGRLKVMTVLVGRREPITFPQLRSLLEMTSGNLSTHLRRLEEAGYVRVRKGYIDRTPVTWVAVTPVGMRRYSSYVDAMNTYLEAASQALAWKRVPGEAAS